MWSGFCADFHTVTNPRKDESKSYRKKINKIRKGQPEVSAKVQRLGNRMHRLEAGVRMLLREEEPNLEKFFSSGCKCISHPQSRIKYVRTGCYSRWVNEATCGCGIETGIIRKAWNNRHWNYDAMKPKTLQVDASKERIRAISMQYWCDWCITVSNRN